MAPGVMVEPLGFDVCHRQVVAVFRALEAVLPAVDELLDREQRDQYAGRRDDRRVDSQREQRWHPIAAEVEHRILPAEPDEQPGHDQHDHAIRDLDDTARRAGHPLGDLGQIEVIVAARRGRHADEHAPREKSGGDLLQPQPRRAQRAGDDVTEHRQREHEDAHAAQDHQYRFQLVERLPLEVAVTLQDQRAEVGHRDGNGNGGSDTCRRAAPPRRPSDPGNPVTSLRERASGS